VIALSERVWPWVPVALLGAMVTGLGVMASIAVNDSGFALERDYYAKAVAYDQEIAQRARNARLGWSLTATAAAAQETKPSRLEVQLEMGQSTLESARVHVEALRNAAAGRVLEAELRGSAPGRYEVELPLGRGGLWDFRFTVTCDGERFTKTERLDVLETAP
jgi:hypothetical protein